MSVAATHTRTVYGTNTELLGIYSEMVENSTFIVRTRRTQKGEKLLVDVTEVSHNNRCNANTTRAQARQAARHFGARGVDFTTLYDNLVSDRKVSRADGTVALVKVRRSAFAFQGVGTGR